MSAGRLKAPVEDGGILAVPPLDQAEALARANRAALAGSRYSLQGRPLPVARAMARAELFRASADYLAGLGIEAPPAVADDALVVASGHQPELFHPGVWVKNFATGALADPRGWASAHLIVDNDLPKSASIRVPGLEGGRLRAAPVEFDASTPELPYEEWSVRDMDLFGSFAERVKARLGGLIAHPLIETFWPRAVAAARSADRPRIGRVFAAARRGLERDWGLRNWDVPMSRLCTGDAFGWFLSHILAQLPRFRAIHNAALARYRAAHRIRSHSHPVPDLGGDGGWLEAPFWAWRAERPRRRPLLARQGAKRLALRMAGEDAPFLELPLTADGEACCAVERMRALDALGVRIRTRALTTTMFARLLVCDLFVHGIGGAKYDELGDAVAREFFGFEPPGYLTLSMTLRLGLPGDGVTPDDTRLLRRALRDLEFNPDRHLAEADRERARPLVAAKRQAIDGPQGTHAERVARWRAIRAANEAVQPFMAGARTKLRAHLASAEAAVRQAGVARSREYAYVLHDKHLLKSAIDRVAALAAAPVTAGANS
jgi:hypothetical protein